MRSLLLANSDSLFGTVHQRNTKTVAPRNASTNVRGAEPPFLHLLHPGIRFVLQGGSDLDPPRSSISGSSGWIVSILVHIGRSKLFSCLIK